MSMTPSRPAFQGQVAAFVEEHDLTTTESDRLLDLTSEVGELCKAWLKATDYGRRPFVADEDWQAEMGDVFFSLVCLANATGVDLEAVLAQVLAKYRQRMAATGSAGSGR